MSQKSEESVDSLWNHFDELRTVIIRILSIMGVGLILTLFFYPTIFSIITKPLKTIETISSVEREEIKLERIRNSSHKAIDFSLPQNSRVIKKSTNVTVISPSLLRLAPGESVELETIRPQTQLAIFNPIDGMIACFKVCASVAAVVTSPCWLCIILQFIVPGLNKSERVLIAPFIGLSFVFLAAGLMFAYFVTLPLSNVFLWTFNNEIGVNIWSLASYLDYTLFIMLANALAFEISLILFFLVHFQIISEESMAARRKHMIVVVLILSAILTPPDVASQLLLAIPLAGLYELAIFYARFLKKKTKLAMNCKRK